MNRAETGDLTSSEESASNVTEPVIQNVTTESKQAEEQKNKPKKKRKKIQWKRFIPLYLIMLPGFVYLFINNIMPMYGITIAFRKLDYTAGILNSPFYGFGEYADYSFFHNFEVIFKSGILGRLLKTTILYNLVFIVLDIVVPVTVAILFNTLQNKMAKKTFQTLILFPNVISWVIISFIVFGLFSVENGFVNVNIIEPIVGHKISFYQEPKYWPFILTFVHLWKVIGFNLVVYLSSILGIDPGLYEAAKLDGANWWQRTIHITLPGLKNVMVTLFVLSLSKMMISDFGLFYQVTKNIGDLYPTTQTLDVYVYNTLMNSPNISGASAVSVFQSLVGFILVVAGNMVVRKIDKDSALF